MQKLCNALWFEYFKWSLDGLDNNWNEVLTTLREQFFEAQWYEVYDFIEFIAHNYPYPNKDHYINGCNKVLERELSAYRFVSNMITKITDETEIREIDKALSKAASPVRTHLNRALELLSDRNSPDYRNSIKESISAVESLVQDTVGQKGTLGQLIKNLEDEIGLHPALKSAFSNLYGYTSDADGVRHSLMDVSKLTFDDAKLFLVLCSAFVNFVQARVASKPIP